MQKKQKPITKDRTAANSRTADKAVTNNRAAANSKAAAGGSTVKGKHHPIWCVLLWGSFLLLVAAIIYLSFQDGEKAQAFGDQVINYVAQETYDTDQVSDQQLLTLTYQIRQAGRVVGFFLIGTLGTLAVHMTFRRANWAVKTGVTAVILVGLAYATEKLKVYIPSRHYDYGQMVLSITAVVIGFLMVSLVTLVVRAGKGIHRLVS